MRWIAAIIVLAACSPAEQDDWDSLTVREKCFEGVGGPAQGLPDYDQFGPVIGRHCSGTDHQDVGTVQRVVYLGDSVTAGTPPTPETRFYRNRLTAALGDVPAESCAAWGAQTDDLLEGDQQLLDCFPAVSPENTLVVMTMGGNDMFGAAQDLAEGGSQEDALARVDASAENLRDAISWFDDNASLFPGGVSVIYGNIYEFTDGEGDLDACPGAAFLGYEGTVPELRDAYIAVNEAWVEIAVQYQRDVIFLLEHFCGHGFHAGDPDNECYRGPGAQTWFDGTCLHPTPDGHEVIADMFHDVVVDREPDE